MNYNNYIISGLTVAGNKVQKRGNSLTDNKRPSKSSLFLGTFITLILTLFTTLESKAQTTLIDPSNEITFGNSATDWKVANDAVNKWHVGPLNGVSGTCAYISKDNGATNTYKTITPTAQTSYFYRDIAVPAGETKIALSFKWKNGGEEAQDLPLVYAASTAVIPFGGQSVSGDLTELTGSVLHSNPNTYTENTFYLPSKFAGNTVRIIFMWKNDANGGGIQPPVSIDDISLISMPAQTITSTTTGGLWNTSTTWIGGIIPSNSDSVIIDSGAIVKINSSTTLENITIKDGAELNFEATGTQFGVENKTLTLNGNLNIDNGGTFKIFDTNSIRQTFNIAGNLTNNGIISVPAGFGSTDNAVITFNGSTPQTISGTGSFGAYLQSVTFANTSTATPNIIWDVNNAVIGRTLTLTGARISLNGKKIFLGNPTSGAANLTAGLTITVGSNSGFLAGGTISRRIANAGSSIAASIDPTATTGQFPIITSNGFNRSLFINRTSGSTATQLAVSYINDNTLTTTTGITETGYTINKRLNSNWTVTLDGISPTANTYKVAIMGANGLFPINGNSRVLYANSSIAGTNELGTQTPSVHRAGLTEANLTQEPLFIGLADADNSIYTVASGDWNSSSTWSTNAVPATNDVVAIQPGHTVTVAGNTTASNVTVALGGALTLNSGAVFNLGDTTNKTRTMTVNGTMTINNGATLNVYGSLKTNLGSTFIQNGGDINVDINSGSALTSLPTGQRGLLFTSAAPANLQLINGNINLLNPHFVASNLVMEVIQYGDINQSGINHTLRFTDDFSDSNNIRNSTDTNGIQYSATASSPALPFVFSNISVETSIAIGTGVAVPNRSAKSTSAAYVGNLTFNSPGAEFSTATLYLSGDLNNIEGTLRTTSTFGFATPTKNSSGSIVISPVSTPQSVTNSNGTYLNTATGNSTVNFAALTINNSSTTGVTFDFAPSMSGTLTLSNGKLNLPSGTSLSMTATSPIVNIIAGNTNSYINGGFQRSIPTSTATSGANIFLLFPVGTADTYKPFWIASANTAPISAVSVRAVSNTGDAGVLENMAATSWITAVTGTSTEMYFRIGDNAANQTNILASAATVAGPYTANFGDSANYIPGFPNQLQTVNPVSGTNFSAAITFADLASCSGTPNPGATLINNINAISKTINLGDELTFSLENSTSGGQVTYIWQKSADNINYTNIEGANAATFTLQPTEAVYYRCMVSCTAITAASTAVQISFVNSISSSTQFAERCGDGSLTLQASGNGGTAIKWYATPQGGFPLATANDFTTPILTETTSYYVAAETTAAGSFTVGPKKFIDILSNSASLQNTKNLFTTVNPVTLTSIDFYPSFVGINTFKLINGATTLTQTITINQAQVDAANINKTANPVPVTVALNFPIVPVNGVTPSLECDKAVYYGSAKDVYNFPIVNNDFQLTEVVGQTNRMLFFNWTVTSDQTVVSSERLAVKATINQTSQIGLSATEASICGAGSTLVTLTSAVENYDTYTWTPNTGVTGDAANGWTFSPAVTTTYTLLGQIGSCQDTETFIVNAGPAATDQTICGRILGEASGGLPAMLGDATVYNLTPKPSTTIKWFADATATTPLANSTKLVNDHTYYVAQNLSCGESLRTPVKVTLNSPAAPIAENTQYFCTTATVNDLTATGVGITWENSSSVALNTTSPILHNNNYFARQTIDGCPSPQALDVLAVDKQKAPFGDAVQSFCGGPRTLADLVVVGAPSAQINWYGSSASTTVLPLTTTLAHNTIYYATQDNSATACPEVIANKLAVTAMINSIPAAPTGDANQTVESGATIADLTVNGQNVVWYESEANALADISPLSSTTVLDDATYYAMQTINGCRSIAPLAVTVTVTVLGVNDFDLAGLKFYPNPVTDFVNISNTASISAINVFNMLGQRVISKTPNNLETKIDMSALPRGTYLLEIDSEGKSAKIKLVKN